MIRKLTLLIATLAALLLVACGGRQSQQIDSTAVDITLEAASTEVGRTQLLITIQDSGGNPIDDATLEIKGDMSHAGMTPVLADSASGTAGVYTVPFEWTMGGDWFVTVQATLNDGTVISKRFSDFAIGDGMEMEMESDEEMDHGEMEMESDEEMEMDSGG